MVYRSGQNVKLQHNIKEIAEYALSDITNKFTPIGEPIAMWIGHDDNNAKVLKAGTRTFSIIVIPCYNINIYKIHVQRYSNPEHPLTFSAQILSFYTCTHALKQKSDKCTMTCTPRFVNSIFCLFPLKHTHKTFSIKLWWLWKH